ncbi:putative tetratricopeptide-like helical domain superfamily [Plasmopara halstedii]
MTSKEMSAGSLETKSNEGLLSLEEVSIMIQKMREEQTSFFDQQRDLIIQQVLERIHKSGVYIAKPSTKNKAIKGSSSTCRLEQSLSNLVHHSLAECGFDHPHAQGTAYSSREQLTKDNSKEGAIETYKYKKYKKDGDFRSKSKSQQEHEDKHQDLLTPSQQLKSSISKSSLKSIYRKKGIPESKWRDNRRPSSLDARNESRAQLNLTDKDSAGSIETIEIAFANVRDKVDPKTLAILHHSEMLLDQVKHTSMTNVGTTSFVEKLRQRQASADYTADDCYRLEKDGEDQRPSEKRVKMPSEISEENLKYDATAKSEIDKVSFDNIRCDMDLLQPHCKPPDNDKEWENELARQILTIYATSVKALEKSSTYSLEKRKMMALNSSLSNNADGKRQVQTFGKEKTATDRRLLKQSSLLPAIEKKGAVKFSNRRASPFSAAICHSWEPSQIRDDGKVIINMPKIPRPIWFAGTGAVKAVWCALANGLAELRPQHTNTTTNLSTTSMCEHQLCEEVRQLEAKKKFAHCISILESLLTSLIRSHGADKLETQLWKQLVVTCNAFASRCIDYRKFSAGLQLMKQAEHLIDNSILVSSPMRMELLAYLYDTYAHYYYRRRRTHAGLQYIMKAYDIHCRQKSWSHLAVCRLHIANLLSFQLKHTEAVKHMACILKMIEENKLDATSGRALNSDSAQKLCLAAVCYNNLAVEQLHMRQFEAASVSSSNAQRLAKLCLGYSNRWLQQFQATSNSVNLAIATLMEDNNTSKMLSLEPEARKDCV